jgi:tRNA A-37 threonylcarbamoyl transferase component Bud32
LEACRVVGEGFELVVIKSNLWRARTSGGALEVTLPLLRLDALASLAGERAASPLLLPYKLEECSPDMAREVSVIARSYRRRVVVEQFYDLATRLGPLTSEALVDPLYPAASRLRLLGSGAPCPRGLETLRDEYAGHAEGLAFREGGLLKLSAPSLRLEFKSIAARIRAVLLGVRPKPLMPRTPWEGARCEPPEIVERPWSLIRLPEGAYEGFCDDEPLKLLGRGECRPSQGLASTYICSEGERKIVVKDYMKMAVKWLPAAIASSVAIRYRLGPRSRLAAEYRYLRRLREILPTPGIIGVCSGVARAAMSREYVEGTPVLDSRDPEHWSLAGDGLARVHQAGYVLGDSNPGNLVVDPAGRLWLVDAEQARSFTTRGAAWDIIVFLAYSGAFGVDRDLLKAFVEGYSNSWEGARGILELAASPTLWMPLSIVPQAVAARRVLREYLAGR